MVRKAHWLAAVGLATGALSLHTPIGVIGWAASDTASLVTVPTFQVDASWPQLPNRWVMGDPSSIAVDRHDHVWILHRPRTIPTERRTQAAPPVLEFDGAGKFVQGWGGPSDQYEWPDTEHGIYVDQKDHVWIGGNNGPIVQVRVSDRTDDMLLEFTSKGRLIRQLGHRDQGRGNADTINFKEPADVIVYPKTNEVFVADGYGNHRVVVLDANTGAFKRMWGAFGDPPQDTLPRPPSSATGTGVAGAPAATPAPSGIGPDGPPQFGIVHAIRVSNDGMVYVADRGNRRVQVFTLEGKFVTQGFVNRTAAAGNTVCGLALSPDPEQQYLYVADFGNARIAVLDRKSLRTLYEFGVNGREPGNFRNPHHLAVDSAGNLYTAEVSPGSRVQKFEFKGIAQVPLGSGAPASGSPTTAVPTTPAVPASAESRPASGPFTGSGSR